MVLAFGSTACEGVETGSSGSGPGASGEAGSTGSAGKGDGDGSSGGVIQPPLEDVSDGPAAGNPDSACSVPQEAQAENVSNPDRVVGDGTLESCTSDAAISAVAQGGVIVFDCGPEPVTIELEQTLRIFNDTGPRIVIDGGGLVTLDGQGKRRILYMNTCDKELKYTTSHCQNQDHPQLTLQDLTFVNGNSSSDDGKPTGGRGGAVWARGGRLKIVGSRFFNNVATDEGPDSGGGAIEARSQYEGKPVFVVSSTFGGQEGFGNRASNGGALGSILVSWRIFNSVLSHNAAVGQPIDHDRPGSGGAIYVDGPPLLELCGSIVQHNTANAFGSAVFHSNPEGTIKITDSVISENTGGQDYSVYPQIAANKPTNFIVKNSTIED